MIFYLEPLSREEFEDDCKERNKDRDEWYQCIMLDNMCSII